MSTRVIITLLWIFLEFFDARSALADEPLSGEGLLALCATHQATAFSAECLAVIHDAERMMRALKEDGNCFADIPEGEPEDDLTRIAVRYFIEHPALKKSAASYALFNAMAAAYPCPK